MKAFNKQNWLITTGMAILMATVSGARAADNLPPIQAPIGFEEGTDTQLQASQMEEILPWATNSLETLKDLLETTKSFSYRDSKDTLIRGIQDVVLASAPKRTELLMRYVLNRALKANQIIEEQADTRQPGVIDIQVRMLKLSVQMALRYYESDVAYLNGRFVERKANLAGLPYSYFGIEYLQFLMGLDQSLFDASAQYAVAVMALGLFQWDLYRDQDRLLFAPVIAKIDRSLKLAPAQASQNDADTIRWLRKLKKVYQDSLAATIELKRKAGQAAPEQTPEPTPAPRMESSVSYANRELYSRYMALLSSSNWSTRLEAVDFLGDYKNHEVAAALIGALADADGDVRTAAEHQLQGFTLNNQDLPALKLHQFHGNWAIRIAVVRTLACVRTAAAANTLIASAADADGDVRGAAMSGILSYRLSDADLGAIQAIQYHANWAVRLNAVKLLASIPSNGATKLLIDMLNDRDADVRAAASTEINRRR